MKKQNFNALVKWTATSFHFPAWHKFILLLCFAFFALKSHSQGPGYTDSIPSQANWSFMGPTNWIWPTFTGTTYGPSIGRLEDIAFGNANDGNLIYVCSPTGGIFKTENGGSTWTNLTDNKLDMPGTTHIALSPVNNQTIYASLGDVKRLRVRPAKKMAKSIDGGSTWTYISEGLSSGLSEDYFVSDFVVHSQSGATSSSKDILIASTLLSIYKSTDGGSSWTKKKEEIGTLDLETHPTSNDYVYAAAVQGFYVSADNGETWTKTIDAADGWPVGDFYNARVATSPAKPDNVYVIASDRDTKRTTFFFSSDKGTSWSKPYTGKSKLVGDEDDDGGNLGSNYALGVSDVDADVILTGGDWMWHSKNKGSTFSKVEGGMVARATSAPTSFYHVDIAHLTYHAGTAYALTDGGIFKSSKGNDGWTPIGFGIGAAQVWNIGCSQTSKDVIWIGLQDGGYNVRLNASDTRHYGLGDGTAGVIDYTNSSFILGGGQNGFLEVSEDMGKTSTKNINQSTGKHKTDESADWIIPLVQDRTDDKIFYAAYEHVWKTTDKAKSWTKLGGGELYESSDPSNRRITAMAVNRFIPTYIYVVVRFNNKYNKMYKTTDGGSTWSEVALPSNAPIHFSKSVEVADIAVSPINPDQIYLMYKRYGFDFELNVNSSVIFWSLDGGASWMDYSEGLPELSQFDEQHDLLAICDVKYGLYLARYDGIWYRDGYTDGWCKFQGNLPKGVPVTTLDIYEPGKMIRAGTYGRGVWESPMVPTEIFTGN